MMLSESFLLFCETSEDHFSVVHSTYFWHTFFSLYQSRVFIGNTGFDFQNLYSLLILRLNICSLNWNNNSALFLWTNILMRFFPEGQVSSQQPIFYFWLFIFFLSWLFFHQLIFWASNFSFFLTLSTSFSIGFFYCSEPIVLYSSILFSCSIEFKEPLS